MKCVYICVYIYFETTQMLFFSYTRYILCELLVFSSTRATKNITTRELGQVSTRHSIRCT